MRLLIIAAVVLFLVIWVKTVLELFRRTDLSGAAKGAWAIIMLIFPVVGILVYMLVAARPQPGGRH